VPFVVPDQNQKLHSMKNTTENHTCLYKANGQCTVARPRCVCKVPLESCTLDKASHRPRLPKPSGYSLVNRSALRRACHAAGLPATPPRFLDECVQALCDYIGNRAASIKKNRRVKL